MRKLFTTQPSLFTTNDLLVHPALGALDGIESIINWSALGLLLPKGKGEAGRPGYAAMTLFRALLLSLWHDLSDVKFEAQLARDLMFRKFCQLELDQGGLQKPAPSGGFESRRRDPGSWGQFWTRSTARFCKQM